MAIRRIVIDQEQDFEIPETAPVYTSGVVCRLLSIPVWVLKQLDKEGIIKPKRTQGRDRLYSKQELKQLKYVWYLMEKRRVKVDGLKVILEIQSGTFRVG